MSGELGQLGERYWGVYLGTVVDVEDPDDLGRLRIETDQYEDSEEDPTWATVVRPLAGAVSTVSFQPKAEDQVVVSYLAGDVRHPIVLGFAHTTERAPSGPDPQKHVISIKDVGTLTFDEDQGKITLAHESGARIELSDGRVAITADDVTVKGEGVVLAPFLPVYDGHQHVETDGTTNATAAVSLDSHKSTGS